MIEPRLNKSLPIRFHDLGDAEFERLCLSLLERESDVRYASLYGTRGQMQRGIDIIANLKDGVGADVGQSKCYAEYTDADLVKAANAFLNHWKYWKDHAIRRFILFVACDVSERKIQDEVLVQKKRFKELGVIFELWGSTTLRNALKPHVDLAGLYLKSPELVMDVTGQAWPPPSASNDELRKRDVNIAALSSQLATLTEGFTTEIAERLEAVRALFRQGKPATAQEQVRALVKGPQWPYVDPNLQAKVLRFEASVTLALEGDVGKAEAYLAEAKRLAPSADSAILDALIAFHSKGPEAALAIVADPRDADAFDLHLGLLVASGRIDEFFDAKARMLAKHEATPETIRLEAMASVLREDVEGAWRLSLAALELAPEREATRATSAMVGYLSAMAPAGRPRPTFGWPEPIAWDVIRRDDESISRLRQAERTFADLAQEVERGTNQDRYEIWRLACLACDVERREEAQGYCIELLNADPLNAPALMWGLQRQYALDRPALVGAYEACTKPDTDQAAAKTALLLEEGRTDDALASVESTREEFEREGIQDAWRIWKVQVLAALGRHEDALSCASEADERLVALQLQALVLEKRAETDDDWAPLVAHLEAAYRETDYEKFLLNACEVQHQREEWTYVADRADEVLNKVPTPTALFLAAHSSLMADRHSQCARLLDDHASLFPQRVLPPHLHRLKVHAQTNMGVVLEARATAEKLLRQSDATPNLLTMVEVQVRVGDLAGARDIARKLVERADLTPLDALRVARVLRIEDLALSRRLWRRAASQNPDAPFILTELMSIGHALGLDREARRFTARLRTLAAEGQGPMRFVTLTDLRAEMQRAAESRSAIWRKYARGEVPVHLAAHKLGLPLVELYVGGPRRHEAAFDPLAHPPTYVRYGGRAVSRVLARNSRLHLDTTALLLAGHLGLLDRLERCFRPLYISGRTQIALLSQIEQLEHDQPSRLEASQVIARLVDDGDITVLKPGGSEQVIEPGDDLLPSTRYALRVAMERDGYLAAHLPLQAVGLDGRVAEVNEAESRHLVSAADLVRVSASHGDLATEELMQAREAVGDSPEEPLAAPTVALADGTFVLFSDNNASMLADGGALDAIARRFEVALTNEYWQSVQADLAEHARVQSLQEFLRALTRRIRDGLESGTYAHITETVDLSHRHDDELGAGAHDYECLMSLFAYAPEPRDVLWVDDRFFNGYATKDGVTPIVGVSEVLLALREFGHLSDGEYFEKLHRLRASNFRYLPIAADELHFRLMRARIQDGELQESRELTAIKRYVAATLLDADSLQRTELPENVPNPHGEAEYILATHHMISEALTRCWSNPRQDVAATVARADWVLENLYTGLFGMRHLLAQDGNRGQGTALVGYDLGMAAVRGLTLIERESTTPTQVNSPVRLFFRWLEHYLIEPRRLVNPEVTAGIADVLVQSFVRLGETAGQSPDVRSKVSMAAVRYFFPYLPDPIKEEMRRNPRLQAALGDLSDAVTLGGRYTFSASDFWKAIDDALSTGRGVMYARAPRHRFTVTTRVKADGQRIWEFKARGKGRPVYRLVPPTWGLLSPDAAERETLLRANARWFDSRAEEREQAIKEITEAAHAHERIYLADTWRDRSVAVYYEDVAKTLASPAWASQIADLAPVPPSGEGLLRHFRFPDDFLPDSASAFEEPCQRLLEDEGVAEAFNRFGSLPLPLPQALVLAFQALSADEQQDLLSRTRSELVGPIFGLHWINLALNAQEPDVDALVAAMAELVGVAGHQRFKDFERLLANLHAEFDHWADARGWSPQLRLLMTWAHAARLFELMWDREQQDGRKIEAFCKVCAKVSLDWLTRSSDGWNASLHPRHVKRGAIVGWGLLATMGSRAAEFLAHDGIRLPLERMFALVTQEEQELLPQVSAPSLSHDLVGAFPAMPLMPEATAWLSEPARQVLTPTWPEEQATRDLERIAAAQDDYVAWLRLEIIVGDRPMFESLRPRWLEVVQNVDFDSLSPHTALEALSFAAGQSSWMRDSALVESITQAITRLAGRMDANDYYQDAPHPGLTEPGHVMSKFVNSVLDIAIASAGEQSASERFFESIGRLFQVSPSMREAHEAGMLRLARTLPVELQEGLWPLILAMRARPLLVPPAVRDERAGQSTGNLASPTS